MVEVFKTNVTELHQVIVIEEVLSRRFPHFRINFDIDDCDRILRIEGEHVLPEQIIQIMDANGYHCRILD